MLRELAPLLLGVALVLAVCALLFAKTSAGRLLANLAIALALCVVPLVIIRDLVALYGDGAAGSASESPLKVVIGHVTGFGSASILPIVLSGMAKKRSDAHRRKRV